ncbi:hypothetical protein [Gimesia sp.]|uniref:hypothetical protein n=1 Tax=Gimesia sp. TaxID=2024833 RepID=UPI000C5ADCA7|nr:hypothetical protein [Gimesia sp.]MAX40054.1 hypothetical protein [Gimesia sp.]HAH47936.1 hypothetical protein [Planctomycetaceae bacterium]HBL42713.1 hypothetical protein [Planctomycetaceae bacterium]|tara:strand:+ start:2487 stop:3158 length:672 start_codon:yes stop_codon:yes gene_type:complete
MPLNIDEKIRRFRFYVETRQIGLAECLGRHFEDKDDETPFKQSGFVILSIASAYFEMIQQFIDGEESAREENNGTFRSFSWDFFKRGFKDVYPGQQWTDDAIRKIYKIVRCGMYHGGMPKMGCHLSRDFKPGIHLCRGEIHINPAALVREIHEHFNNYIDSLKVDAKKQANFVAMCEIMGFDDDVVSGTHCDTPGGTIFTTTTSNPHAPGDEPMSWHVETEEV